MGKLIYVQQYNAIFTNPACVYDIKMSVNADLAALGANCTRGRVWLLTVGIETLTQGKAGVQPAGRGSRTKLAALILIKI